MVTNAEPVRDRILFVGHDVTLAHLARPLALGEMARLAGWDVTLACSSRVRSIPHAFGGALLRLETVNGERFIRNLALGRPVFSEKELRMQLAEDFSLLDNVKPVMVIGDFRLTMGIAARKAGIPYGNLANAYWSRYARPEYMVPDLPAVRLFGSRLSQRIFNLVRPLAFAVHARPLRTLYREHGLSVADASLGELYTTGDVRLFSDVPGLYRGRNFPDSCCFIGPVAWAPEIATPQWWGNLHPERPTAYIYLGSSGDQSLLPSIVNALSSAGLQCIVAGGAADIDKNSGAVFTAPMLPGGVAAERADIVVCNGGSPSSYQALAAGKPVLGIASNLDQYLNMRFVEACGAGITMRSDGFRAGALQDSVRRLLSESGFRNQAARLRDEIQATDTEQIFTTIIKQHAHSASTS